MQPREILGRLNLSQRLARSRQCPANVEAFGFVGVTRAKQERFERFDVMLPDVGVDPLLGGQALCVPVAGKQVFAREEPAEIRVLGRHLLEVSVAHDVQQRLQRGACPGDAAVIEIGAGHPLLRHDDIVDALDKCCQILQFWPEHLVAEDHVRDD